MGSRCSASLNAVHSLRHAGIRPHVLGPLRSSRILCRGVLSVRGNIGLAVRWPAGSHAGAHARHRVGIRPVLRRHYGCELEVPLCHTHRVLNRDYRLLERGSMDFSEAGRFLTPCDPHDENQEATPAGPTRSIGCGLVRESPKLIRESPKLIREPPRLVSESPRLFRESPGLVREPPGLVREPPGLVREPPGLVREPPGLVREPRRLVR
jgi:hypothetical protein